MRSLAAVFLFSLLLSQSLLTLFSFAAYAASGKQQEENIIDRYIRQNYLFDFDSEKDSQDFSLPSKTVNQKSLTFEQKVRMRIASRRISIQKKKKNQNKQTKNTFAFYMP